MILLTLIKKEIIQFFRKKYDVITMFIFPLVLILVMGSALNGLMSMEKNIFKDKTIYFNTNDLGSNNQNIKMLYDFMTTFQKSTKVNFRQVNDKKEGIEYVNNNKGICFIDIYDKDYNYYRNERRESSESKIFRNIFEQYLKKYLLITSIQNENSKDIQSILSKEVEILIEEEGIGREEINSYTYYTFAELTLIMLYISGITCASMYNERYLNTMTRLKVSRANKTYIILSKVSLGVIIGVLQTIVVYMVSKFALKVNWGPNLFQIFIVLLSLIIFSSVFGIFLSMIFSDEKTANSVNNILLVVMGFLGGAYVPICLVKSTKIASLLCNFIPTYWANISLISLTYRVDNYYPIISVIVSLGLSIILLKLAIFISKLKVGGSFD